MTTHLVISGGGIKGSAIIGALQVIADKGHLDTVHTYIGSSVGAILCMLLAVGYTPAEMHKILMDIDLEGYIDYNFIDFFQNIGIAGGTNLVRLLGSMLRKKGIDRDITFATLKRLLGKTLTMTGSNLTKERTDYFSPDHCPDMQVLEAIRITISYPLFFTPPIHNGDMYVDGALFDPYPINLCPEDAQKIGILIDAERVFNPDYQANNTIEGFGQYLHILVKTMIGRYVKLSCNHYFEDTIGIDLSDFSAMNFGIDKATKMAMYNAGLKAAKRYYETQEDDD